MNQSQKLKLNEQLISFNSVENPLGFEFTGLIDASEIALNDNQYLVIGSSPIGQLLLSKTIGEIIYYDDPHISFVNSSLSQYINCLNQWHQLLMNKKNMSDAESVRGALEFLKFIKDNDPKASTTGMLWADLAAEVIEMHSLAV